MGVLYLGLMITKNGPKLVEYNCRFGDPECAGADAAPEKRSADRAAGGARWQADSRLDWRDEAALTVVMASKGYPGAYEKGHVISGLDEAAALPGITIFHAGTERRGGEIVAVGGRVLNVTATGQGRRRSAEPAPMRRWQQIHWQGAFCRTRYWLARAEARRLTALQRLTRHPRPMLFLGRLSFHPAGRARRWRSTARWRISSMTMSAPAPTSALDGITHYAKAGHWLAAAILALIVAALACAISTLLRRRRRHC